MGTKPKPSKWDRVIPTNYDALCRHRFRLAFPKHVRVEVNSRMREDLTQEMEALVWEARAKGMDVPQASRLFKNGLRRFSCKVSGWKNGYIKREKRNYWKQMEFSNTLSNSTEWDEEEGEHLNVRVYRRLGIEGNF
ncbi:MAG: hypothetical protein HY673_12480 [Chloroflexi bacterium]|nr:hypothetical protein [Chloroflexota bacterium]